MFGHQDDQNNNQPNPHEPAADGSLAQDASAPAVPAVDMSMPTPVSITPTAPAVQDETNNSTGPDVQSGTPADSIPAAMPAPAGADDLLNLKQQALQQLTPLVGHLEQTPEERFRTTMMMIQAADNQALLKDAYDAAQAIPDEKIRAQALLDVVNEINYFTQQQDTPQTPAA